MTETVEAPSKALATREHEQLVFADLEKAANIPQGAISMVGLLLTDGDMRYEDWEQLGRSLGEARRWTSWAIGDWMLFGEALFGEESSQAAESTRAERLDVVSRVTGLAPATLQNYARHCGNIPHSVRRVELEFGVHEAVSALERSDQIYWLQQAVDNAWGRDDLRQAIRDALRPPTEEGEQEVLPVEKPRSIADRIEDAARAIYATWQPTSDGSYLVPPESAARLVEALGEE